MPQIEIYTTQNVSIEYQLATLKDRGIAFAIDFLILVVSIFALLVFFMGIFGEHNSDKFMYLVAMPVFFFYSLFFEIFNNGKSPGKEAMKIQVVKITGEDLALNDYLTRWTFRMIDIYLSLGAVASFLISSNSKNQRLGDILANTAVIKFKPDYSIDLSSLTDRTTASEYEAKFPQVRMLKEEDMLLVKSVVARYRKYPNTAHREALDMLVKKLCERLGLKNTPVNKISFLETLVRDYVVLTR